MSKLPHHVALGVATLRFRGGGAQALRTLKDSQWKQVLHFLDSMHLTLCLGKHCGEDLPDWLRSRIATNLSDNIEHLRRLKAGYVEIATALQLAGVQHLVLKGFAHSERYSPGWQCRMQSDIDLYCPAESLFPARDALKAIGFLPSQLGQYLASDQHLPKMCRPTDWRWSGNHFDPEIPISIDLHQHFWNASTARFGPADLDCFWERRVTARFEELRFQALHSADSLAYASLHLIRHALSRNLLTYHVYEIAWFLNRSAGDSAFWNGWLGLHDPSLRRLEAIAFRMAHDWFACDLSPQAEEEINRLPPLIQSWFQRYSASPLGSWVYPDKQTLWLHLALLDSIHDRRKVLRRAIFPAGIPPLKAFNLSSSSESRDSSATLRKYLGHVCSRARYHAALLPGMVWHGIGWWLQSSDLNQRFRTLLKDKSIRADGAHR